MRILIVAALAGLLGGCALTEADVAVPYTAGTQTDIGHGTTVALTTTDARTADRERISTKLNGYGMEMAPIRSDRPVPEIVQQALKSEFQARGFQLGSAGCPVTVAVDRFYSQYHVHLMSGDASGDVGLTVTVSDTHGGKLFSATFHGTSHSVIYIANGSNAAASVSAALKDAIDKMFADPAFLQALANQSGPHSADAGGTIAPTKG